MDDTGPVLCARCLRELAPGQDSLYVVKIEAFADPTMPDASHEELEATDFRKSLERLFRQTQNMSEQELMDQVYRRMTIHLCHRCYAQWIDNPAGTAPPPES